MKKSIIAVRFYPCIYKAPYLHIQSKWLRSKDCVRAAAPEYRYEDEVILVYSDVWILDLRSSHTWTCARYWWQRWVPQKEMESVVQILAGSSIVTDWPLQCRTHLSISFLRLLQSNAIEVWSGCFYRPLHDCKHRQSVPCVHLHIILASSKQNISSSWRSLPWVKLLQMARGIYHGGNISGKSTMMRKFQDQYNHQRLLYQSIRALKKDTRYLIMSIMRSQWLVLILHSGCRLQTCASYNSNLFSSYNISTEVPQN